MAQGDRRDWEIDTGELIEESGRQLRQSRDLINHLDQALARSEQLLKQQPAAQPDDRTTVVEDVGGGVAAS
ncbi:MAG TPA: hypothetical protein VFA11_09565 [Acidimicrobiales bacterium]|nr:hypothetical protein [Acidimicrobiales bacterium]